MKEFSRRAALAPILGLVPLAVFSALRSNALAYSVVPGSDDSPSSDPWAASQTVTPAALVAELIAKEQAGKPTVVCVGFRALYQGENVAEVFNSAWAGKTMDQVVPMSLRRGRSQPVSATLYLRGKRWSVGWNGDFIEVFRRQKRRSCGTVGSAGSR